MKISIQHQTTYHYDAPLYLGLQRLKLQPSNNASQQVRTWHINLDGAEHALHYIDHLGNETQLIKLLPNAKTVTIAVQGIVETENDSGIFGADSGFFPAWFFKNQTKATEPGRELRTLIQRYTKNDGSIAFFHELSENIRQHVTYTVGATTVNTSAEEAWIQQSGVCQDHSHIMIGCARELGYEARYVSGYLLMNDRIEQSATHAWCEININGLGWVGFDVSNGYSPDQRYVRLAIGRDYQEAAPIHGLRYGHAKEELDVTLQIQQQ